MKHLIIVLLSINILFAIEIEHNVKEVTVSLNSLERGFKFIERRNGKDAYFKFKEKNYYLKNIAILKKTGTSSGTYTKIIDGKKIKQKFIKQHYGINLSCLKSNNVYFNCVEY